MASSPWSSGRYEVQAALGEGGMGVVERVLDRATGSVVARKRLVVPGEGLGSVVTGLFEREYHALAELTHPAVIQVLDYGVDDQGPYYTMELLEGSDLRRVEGMAPEELAAILCGVASALSLLHARRLIHRDVTSANIRVVGSGRAKLIDFGALSPMGPTDRLVGTPRYVAPEAVLMQPLDGRTDLYSLGVVLYRALVGRYPYPARSVRELREAWRVPPLPPVEISSAVPKRLSDLVMGLIALEPERRPRDAAEVMDRLAAIAGIPPTDTPEASRAHLVTPTLVGRGDATVRVRAFVVGALRGHGRALLFTGPAGVGRSRMLDAAALEAQVLGATVLRLGEARVRGGDFSAADGLLREVHALGLDLAAPDVAAALGGGEGVAHLGASRGEIMSSISRLLVSLSKQVPLAILVDDVHLLDEPSIAALVSLLRALPKARIALVASVPDEGLADPPLGLRLLVMGSNVYPLEPLDDGNVRTLVRSLFGAVPHGDALSAQLHRFSRGRPRDAMAIAEHLVERGTITYRAGTFSIPESIDFATLPEGLSATLQLRVGGLSPIALLLAQSHALSGLRTLSLSDCRRLCAGSDRGELFRALDELVAGDVFGLDGADYVLRHEGWRAVLAGSCTDEARAARHRAIAVVIEARGGDPLARAYHLMRASDPMGAELAARYAIESLGQGPEVFGATRLGADALGWLFESALEAFRDRGPEARHAVAALRHFVMTLGVFHDVRWFYRWIPETEGTLKRDSGHVIWESLGDGMEPAARLFSALGQAQAAYDAAPQEHEHPPAEAIRLLVQYVVAAIAVGTRASDCELRRRLPGLIEPFAPLSPVVAAMVENCRSAAGSTYGDYESAARLESVVAALEAPDAASMDHAAEIAAACSYAMGAYRSRLGVPEALASLDRIANHPRHASNALRVRALCALQRGGWTEAASLRAAAEQYELEHDLPQLFGLTVIVGEIDVYARGLDLTAVKQLISQLEPQAERHEGWQPHLDYARGEYLRLLGDLPAALEAFDRAVARTRPRRDREHPDAGWYTAEAAALETLLELGRTEECLSRAARSLSLADGAAQGVRYDGVKRALALCEARTGSFEAAMARLDAMVAHRLQMKSEGLALGLVHEAQSLVALWQKDHAAAERYFTLAAEQYGTGERSGFARRLDVLRQRLAEGERATSGIGPVRPERISDRAERAVSEALSDCEDARRRASEGLALLLRTSGSGEGHLYLLARRGLGLAASSPGTTPPPGLDEYLTRCMDFEVGSRDTGLPLTSVTAALEVDAAALLAPFVPDPASPHAFHVLWIRASLGARSSVIGAAALLFGEGQVPATDVVDIAAAFGDFLARAGDTVLGDSDQVTRPDLPRAGTGASESDAADGRTVVDAPGPEGGTS